MPLSDCLLSSVRLLPPTLVLPACFAQQYNFTAPNIALLLIVLGISGTVVQGAGIAPLARLLGYKWLLVGGLVCTFANILLFAVVHLKWFVYVQIVRPTPSSPAAPRG